MFQAFSSWCDHDLDVMIFVLDQFLETFLDDIVNMYARRHHAVKAFESP